MFGLQGKKDCRTCCLLVKILRSVVLFENTHFLTHCCAWHLCVINISYHG